MFDELDFPVIAAPMAGGPSTPELVAAVSQSGGFGFLAAGYLSVEQLAAQLTATREISDKPFGVNLFAPGNRSKVDVSDYARALAFEADRLGVSLGQPTWDDDAYSIKLETVVRQKVPVVSFTFGLPGVDDVHRLHDAGSTVVVTVTNPEEAEISVESGADVLCVQGTEAGGHRGLFQDDPAQSSGAENYGLLAALRLISTKVDIPLIAAGGLMRGADIAAVLTAGARAAQLGTAFLLAEEAGTNLVYRQALGEVDRTTTFTRAFSGRLARGIRNRFIDNHNPAGVAYPQINNLTRPLRAAAAQTGDFETMSLWAGQTFSLAQAGSAAEIMARLKQEFDTALAQITQRFGERGTS